MDTITIKTQINTEFAKDVRDGLSSFPKTLPSKYFYDQRGDDIFKQIMKLPEYYLTNCETEIILANKSKMLEYFSSAGNNFNLIELGAGDGCKTKHLLRYFIVKKVSFTYSPIDISQNIVNKLQSEIHEQFPGLSIQPVTANYLDGLKAQIKLSSCRNVILFLGSSIGNFNKSECLQFMNKISHLINPGDLFLIGFDLKKHPQVILDAYNDGKQVTKEFNINLLRRINEELGGNFDLSNFSHYPTYNPETGEASSYLVSDSEQAVRINALDSIITFKRGEWIKTEVSVKYDPAEIEDLANRAGFIVEENFLDSNAYFVQTLWKLK